MPPREMAPRLAIRPSALSAPAGRRVILALLPIALLWVAVAWALGWL